MKITKQQLKQIIKEEISVLLNENEEMAKKQLDVLINVMKKNPQAYEDPLMTVATGTYMDVLDSWLRQVYMSANRAGQGPVAQLASRIHTNWFGTGKTLPQEEEEELARYVRGH